MITIHIHSPLPVSVQIHHQTCHDKRCKGNKSPHVVYYYEWYEPHRVCLRCGRVSNMTTEGIEHHDLPGGRGCADRQRQENIERAKQRWRKAKEVNK